MENRGELIRLETRVDHLREAVPFDRIIVIMALKVLKSGNAVFHFECFRLDPDGTKNKTGVWRTECSMGGAGCL
ncbi:MAG: hypothetical protein U9N60_10410 [Thermodesulfobacteriota bacterium]|nr:hypothetical protein [Thermodesulfobacteriota bacterium]